MNILNSLWDITVQKSLKPALVISFLLVAVAATFAQTPAPSPAAQISGLIGEVKAIDTATNQVQVRSDNGVIATVGINDKTQYKRMALGAKSLTGATDVTVADVGQGDRIWARWRPGTDQKTTPAAQLVIMSKADLAKKQQQDKAEWQKRGVSGIVASVNPSTQEITVSSRSLMGQATNIIIPVNEKVLMRRYPPDTIPKYSEAKPGKFEEVKVGDQLRALGDKSADGTHMTAEEVVFGTFKIAGGTVTALDVASNQLRITDLQTKKPLTINFKPDTVIRRFPQGFGAMLGGGMGGPGGPGAGQGQARPPGQGQTQTAQGPGAAEGQKPQGAGGPQGGRMGGGNMADMLERLPVISLNELKVGDTILLSSLPGADPTQLTAISLVSGVEPLLQMMAARQQQGGARPQGGGVDLNGSFGGMFGGAGGP
jgi:co-chaperonin GroES (HSP10)